MFLSLEQGRLGMVIKRCLSRLLPSLSWLYELLLIKRLAYGQTLPVLARDPLHPWPFSF